MRLREWQLNWHRQQLNVDSALQNAASQLRLTFWGKFQSIKWSANC